MAVTGVGVMGPSAGCQVLAPQVHHCVLSLLQWTGAFQTTIQGNPFHPELFLASYFDGGNEKIR